MAIVSFFGEDFLLFSHTIQLFRPPLSPPPPAPSYCVCLFALCSHIFCPQCWGRGWAGALGVGDVLDRGSRTGTMGDALPALSLGTGKVAVSPSPAALETSSPTPGPTTPPTPTPTAPPTTKGVSHFDEKRKASVTPGLSLMLLQFSQRMLERLLALQPFVVADG